MKNLLYTIFFMVLLISCTVEDQHDESEKTAMEESQESEEKPQSTHPVWSPDGMQIAFINNKIGVSNNNAINFEVYVMNADGSNVRRLTENTAFESEIAWSPDGNMLAFKSYRDENDEIYIIDLTSGEQTNISNTPARESDPKWSKDGSKVIYSSNRDHEKGELYSYDLSTAETSRITNNDFSEGAANWSPDGELILFTSNMDGDDDIWMMETSGENLIQLTNNELMDWYPLWSPDGSQILFTYGDWNTDIFELRIMNADGSNQRTLIKDVDSGNASWHPSGNKIAFGSMKSGSGEVYVYDLDSEQQIQVTDNQQFEVN